MKKLLIAGAAAAMAACFMGGTASAATNVPVPDDAFITFNGQDWAWASPCSPDGCGGYSPIDMSFQATQGWRVAEAADLLTGPSAADFGGKCAASYFSTIYTHCDAGDGAAGYIWNAPGEKGLNSASETWVLRAGVNGAVPEPATWAMMIFGFGAVGGSMRSARRRKDLVLRTA